MPLPGRRTVAGQPWQKQEANRGAGPLSLPVLPGSLWCPLSAETVKKAVLFTESPPSPHKAVCRRECLEGSDNGLITGTVPNTLGDNDSRVLKLVARLPKQDLQKK